MVDATVVAPPEKDKPAGTDQGPFLAAATPANDFILLPCALGGWALFFDPATMGLPRRWANRHCRVWEGSMATVSDFVVQRLKAWGVSRIYGYSGDGINGVIGAIQRDGTIEFIQVRHEEMAAFMAVGHAKFAGEIGVCLATGGPVLPTC